MVAGHQPGRIPEIALLNPRAFLRRKLRDALEIEREQAAGLMRRPPQVVLGPDPCDAIVVRG